MENVFYEQLLIEEERLVRQLKTVRMLISSISSNPAEDIYDKIIVLDRAFTYLRTELRDRFLCSSEDLTAAIEMAIEHGVLAEEWTTPIEIVFKGTPHDAPENNGYYEVDEEKELAWKKKKAKVEYDYDPTMNVGLFKTS